jgi:hypothetical protein
MDDLMMWDTECHSQVEITNLEEVVDPENPAVKNFTISMDSVSTIQRYKDMYKEDISVTSEGLMPPPNTVRLHPFDSGASLMSFAESVAMQSYKSEVESVTEKVDNVQAYMRSMKAGIDSIQAFMKQLQPTGTVKTTMSRTEPSSLSRNTGNPKRVAGSG